MSKTTRDTSTSQLNRIRAAVQKWEDEQLRNMVVPPPEVLSQPVTKADVAAYPVYFIVGPGREAAENAECGHGYMLTSSCPGCDAETTDEPEGAAT